MIFFWGVPGDHPLAAVRAALTKPYFFFDQHDSLQTNLEMQVDRRVTGKLTTRHECVRLEDITAAYIRPYDSARVLALEQAEPDHKIELQVRSLDDALLTWCEMTPARVINVPSAMASNNSKPYQASLIEPGIDQTGIRQSGFRTPDTLLTTEAGAVETFLETHTDVVYKSVSGVRSIVTRLTAAHRNRFGDLACCPTQFQEYVKGVDYRVHVVGDEVFACQIQCSASDYRYPDDTTGQPVISAVRLPPTIEDRCRDLTERLGLWVSGIDLRRTSDDEWFCFEVNPSPGFTFYQQSTGQPIAAAIARFLMSDAKSLESPPRLATPREPAKLVAALGIDEKIRPLRPFPAPRECSQP